jgi:hypothetical protein
MKIYVILLGWYRNKRCFYMEPLFCTSVYIVILEFWYDKFVRFHAIPHRRGATSYHIGAPAIVRLSVNDASSPATATVCFHSIDNDLNRIVHRDRQHATGSPCRTVRMNAAALAILHQV